MKTFLQSNKFAFSSMLLFVLLISSYQTNAQSGSGGSSGSGNGSGNGNANGHLLTNGLKFVDPELESGTALQQGAVYRFNQIAPGIDATIRIDSLVNGARVTKIDDNSGGLGYREALQPEVRSGNLIGRSYAVFTVRFLQEGTNVPEILQSVNATALDIDGNLNLKEFAEVGMGYGSLAKYMGPTLDISLLDLLLGKFKGENILGIERTGIDTSALGNMFTTSNAGISSFTVKYGTFTLLPTTTTRQFSLYMKGFTYPDQVTLPVELASFTAMLNNDKVDLKWITASEKNVSHFTVEKSKDGKNFSEAGLVFAYGNSSDNKTYQFSDNSINPSETAILYYRLRTVDIDQKFQYSTVKLVRIGRKNEQTLQLLTYPNPASQEIRITIPADWQGRPVSYELISQSGQVLIRLQGKTASQTEILNIARFTTGYYIVRASYNGTTLQQKVIKK